MSKKNWLFRATPAECHDLSLRRATPNGTGVIGGTASGMPQALTTTTGVGVNPQVPRVAKMSRHRPNSDASQSAVHHQRPGCGSTVAVIIIGFSVQAQPEGADQRDGRRAVRHMLGRGA